MAEIYRATLGSYTFDVQPITSIKSVGVIRESVSPNVCVARLYEWRMRCRVPATTDAIATVPPSAATNLGTFLSSAFHTRTLPTSLSILDSAGTAIPQIGDISVSGGWEDLQLVDFDLASVAEHPGQMVAGAYFELSFRARKSLPDSNGICELDLEYETTSDDVGREVRRVSGLIRLSLAAYTTGTRITDAAVVSAAGIKLPCPAGWNRSRGNNSNGFDVRYPKYPRLIEATVVSEVTLNGGGVSGASGAKSADVAVRHKDDPARGLLVTTTTAETTGPDSGAALEWVQQQQPPESTGETLEEASKKHARGEWETRGPLTAAAADAGKVTRVTRAYTLRGGERSAYASAKASGLRPKIVSGGPFSPYVLAESIRIFARGPEALTDVPAPKPLGAPWVLDGDDAVDAMPVVEEDANYPGQRVWVRVLERRYLWNGDGDPRSDGQLVARVMSDATTNIAVVEVG